MYFIAPSKVFLQNFKETLGSIFGHANQFIGIKTNLCATLILMHSTNICIHFSNFQHTIIHYKKFICCTLISLPSVFSKIFQKHVNNGLVDLFEKYDLFSCFQYSFRSTYFATDILQFQLMNCYGFKHV